MPVVLYEKEGRIAYITINRPEVLNAMNSQLKKELANVWVDFRDDPEVWIAIVTGAGDRAFSSGSDVKEVTGWDVSSQAFHPEPEPLQEGQIEIWKPMIAAINGWCVGGGLELALVCDIRIATESARFGLMEPKVGSFAGSGTIRLPRQVPFAIAMEMILTGDTIDAQRAYEIGLINQVVPSKNLMPAAEKMAERILACAPLMVRASKEQALRGFDIPLTILLRAGIGTHVRATLDYKEGRAAFMEKRKPEWTGR